MKIDLEAIDYITTGSSIFGTGGGGDPYIGSLLAKSTVREHGPVDLIDINDMPDDAYAVAIAYFGVPAIMTEKLFGYKETEIAFDHLCCYLQKPIFGVFPIECGGINGLAPISVAATKKIPIIDCDGMGRAFPRLEMVTFTIHGLLGPISQADIKGNKSILCASNAEWGERVLSALVIPLGGVFAIACFPLKGYDLKKASVRHSVSKAYKLGKRVHLAKTNPIDEIVNEVNGFKIIEGKVIDVQREIDGRWNTGAILIEGLNHDTNRSVRVSFQNEYLQVIENEKTLAVVPDMISILYTQTGDPVTAESIRYGLRITVIAYPCDKQWRTPGGLAIAGPKCFGLDVPFKKVEDIFNN